MWEHEQGMPRYMRKVSAPWPQKLVRLVAQSAAEEGADLTAARVRGLGAKLGPVYRVRPYPPFHVAAFAAAASEAEAQALLGPAAAAEAATTMAMAVAWAPVLGAELPQQHYGRTR
jgi:hypothetical protein